MKIRTDFVTNSSSSSFIIAYRDLKDTNPSILDKCPFIKILPKFLKFALQVNSDNYEAIVSTKTELDEFIKNAYGWSAEVITNDLHVKEVYQGCVAALDRGCIILFKDVDYREDDMLSLIHTLHENGCIEILEEID